ncbi:GDSL-like Lipase/Acylhydrolase family protein [Micromonospora coriariae]|uniref:GDSL-like Lipase/Acylhydrolase family protein n=1 Tax=Micromonospora coriariae TaxID=285665 RepID=A0A1C4V9T1_9ACTN|nr:NocE [Micromonospora coriariae]SCE80758.1 GDSL-like Lipase/Acylhydrolase family protein [Micromonospora coriariae]
MLAAITAVAAASITIPFGAPQARAAEPESQAARAEPAVPPKGTDTRHDTVAPERRDEVLAPGWRTSADLSWTTSGDVRGFHVLAATARSGYTWRTVATLAEPGFDADQWIGNACLTGSGRRLVVVYAPRTFTNKADLFDRGGFTAVVDLVSGKVTKLPVQSSLAYFNPGCGTGESAVVAQFDGERIDRPTVRTVRSRLLTVDAEAGSVSAPIQLETELSSAVPTRDGIVAAGGGRLLRVGTNGSLTPLAATEGTAFRLVPDKTGGVLFMDRAGDGTRVKRTLPRPGSAVTTLAEGKLSDLGLARGSDGRAFLTGAATRVATLPTSVRRLDVPAGAELSSEGAVALTRISQNRISGAPTARTVTPDSPEPVRIEARVTATGDAVAFEVAPVATGAAAASGRTPHPKLGRPAARGKSQQGRAPGAEQRAAASPNDPVEAERTCSVPRNDPRNQALQPKPRQVEWAVDQAITDSLHNTREANWKNLGMPAYSPQGLFPSVELTGGGRVPAQIMLGIIAQESNMWQAARFALPGVTANPLIGNYYGIDIYNASTGDDWDINWADADCGYGATQVTDHMRLAGKEKGPGDEAWDYQTQRAVALDFATNVAAGLQILQKKWNETKQAGLTVHDADPAAIENWFFAVWAYNSGFYPNKGDGQPWGVGWLNNPINPRYDPQRLPFLEVTYDDARTPQKWPYPEKVIGWAGHPIELNESPETLVAGYRAAWWTTVPMRVLAKPPLDLFCNQSNHCDPAKTITPDDPDVIGEPAGPCENKNAAGYYDLRCWYNQPVGWKAEPGEACVACGNEVLRFDPGYAYQDDGTSFPPKCDLSGLPAGAKVIDDVPDGTPSIRPNCGRPWSNAGTFRLDFASDSGGRYPAKVDLHQIGAGFGGHFWRGHTRTATDEGGKLRTTGTWALSQPMSGWTRVMVSVPDHGAWTGQARYTINLGNGKSRYRVVNQTWQTNRWVDLGTFNLAGNASVSLSTVTADGRGEDSIIFDAVAFAPTSRPSAFYVAMGDSYSAGEGGAPYDRNSDYNRESDSPLDKNACHRSQQYAYPRLVTLPGQTQPIASQAAEGKASFALIACSGAMTTSVTTDAVNSPPSADDQRGSTVWGSKDYHYGELTQVDQGYLDEDTTHVSISIGGNDARFGDVMKACMLAIGSCDDDDFRVTRQNDVVDPAPLKQYETNLIRNQLPSHLLATYRAIHAKAPNAQIVVVGYPQLFDDHPSGGCYLITPEEQQLLNSFGTLLNISIAKAVETVHGQGVNIRFVDPNHRWRIGTGPDTHGACPDVDGSWIHAVIATSESGSGRDVPGAGSWHPKVEGQRQLALLVNSSLAGYSSASAVQTRISNYVASRAADGWTISAPQAQNAADTCLRLARVGGLVGDPCMTMPILFPTSADAAGAANNDMEALKGHPSWVALHYVKGSEKEKGWSRSWMNLAATNQTTCPTPRPTGMQCDEFPFYTSEQGAAWDRHLGENSPTSTRLRLVPTAENRAEGTMVGAMYTKCQMASGTYTALAPRVLTGNGQPYLTIPLVGTTNIPKTFYTC